MQLLLESRPKTVPCNYDLILEESYLPGSEQPGFSIDEAQWDKAKRQEDPNYDWYAYQTAISNPLFDHPSFANSEHDLEREWEDLLRELEPFNRRVV